jgi:hypothetical protein
MAAQSLHWVDPRVRYAKPAVVLARNGMLAVIRNEKQAFEGALRDELDAAYRRWRPADRPTRRKDAAETSRRALVGEIEASGLFGAVDVRVYSWTTTYTTERYLELFDTYSDQAVLSPEHRAPLYQSIADVLERRGGVVEMRYVSMAFMARRACPE